MKKVALAADHGGVQLKDEIIEYLKSKQFDILDLGTNSGESVDYPEYGAKAAVAVTNGEADCAIIMCGSGIGISIAANKFKGVRCALCFDAYTAKMCRQHNDANIMALGGRITTIDRAKDMVDLFLETEFEGGRHQRRIDKLDALAAESWK
ncbi:sugar-phosphate isomerase, RpiB/LacA/LacB family [Denitrovibrio acetiphilus DSM 12809]|uniref:Sugar-phosphate isomerase, RpiB/LacA/LacB family n=1 Tax=Denitrovibrio acetiphilus (strain DSM 12809 / NBRC 114555 / N2460) TaxID=522772 RepID=D4H119_DENA2|nr:ribose 5-phosphate isomerase B [Denitrovibrio acetiphilus]ADD68682.1 sugar-phosphate isomerase, RpiB/LacA/LacB family [Denitrovibrio acetiphilus DSM 12809]